MWQVTHEPTLCMNVWGREGWGSISCYKRDPHSQCNEQQTYLSDPPPKKTNQKNQRGVYERKHKAKDYNTISKLLNRWSKDLSGWRKQRSHHINSSLLWISSSMNECLANFGGSIFRWLIQTTCGVHLCCWRIGTLDRQFLLLFTYPVPYCHRWVGAPPSLPFPNREPAGQFRVCKTPWLAHSRQL